MCSQALYDCILPFHFGTLCLRSLNIFWGYPTPAHLSRRIGLGLESKCFDEPPPPRTQPAQPSSYAACATLAGAQQHLPEARAGPIPAHSWLGLQHAQAPSASEEGARAWVGFVSRRRTAQVVAGCSRAAADSIIIFHGDPPPTAEQGSSLLGGGSRQRATKATPPPPSPPPPSSPPPLTPPQPPLLPSLPPSSQPPPSPRHRRRLRSSPSPPPPPSPPPLNRHHRRCHRDR